MEDSRYYEMLPPAPTNSGKFVRDKSTLLKLLHTEANRHLDKMAIENRAQSMDQDCLEPLDEGTYVLKLVESHNLGKASVKWFGPYKIHKVLRPDIYILFDVVQDIIRQDHVHRSRLITCPCSNDAEAIEYARRDCNEITPIEVLSHRGSAAKVGSLYFHCKIKELKTNLDLLFNDVKYVKVIQSYCLEHAALASLKRYWINDGAHRKRVASNKIGGDWTV